MIEELFSDAINHLKTGWCQKVMARSADGGKTPVDSFTANQWCAVGALHRAWFKHSPEIRLSDDYWKVAALIAVEIGYIKPENFRPENYLPAIAKWNDTEGRTKEEVIAVFQKAKAIYDEQKLAKA